MKLASLLIPGVVFLMGCGTPPYRIVYSNGFSFARYSLIVMSKPDDKTTSTSLYGMDIELANMLARYNMKIVGDKDYQTLTKELKEKTLFARMSLISTSKKENLVSISFDDSISGMTVASVTARAKGDMFDVSDRTKAMEAVSDALLQALQRDKGLSVMDAKASPSK